jgi:predicted  nucleic acid-binding Zn-ribbon protein
MESEALRKIRTMRQVKTSLDVARKQKLRTTDSLSKTSEELDHLESLIDRRTKQSLEKESKSFAAQEATVHKSRQRVLRAREKLAATINKNRALTELRHELQRARWEGRDPTPPQAEQPHPEQNLRQMEIRY